MNPSEFLLEGSAGGLRRREIVTPEGVPLRVTLASGGDRVAAFVLDALILLALVVGAVAALISMTLVLGGYGNALGMLLVFVVVNFYFPFLEIRWQGQTLGKRIVGIRVIDRHGGRLTGEAIFARNLTRYVEVLLPGAALSNPEAIWPGATKWVGLIAAGWLLILMMLPLFNRDRLRLGDLVAGTLVVRRPRRRLRRDLVAQVKPTDPPSACSFTNEQLDHYGIYELQVLEGLLRERRPDPARVRIVAEKIQQRIGWQDPEGVPDLQFLREFYAAQRGRLEGQLLLGERRERKPASPDGSNG